jgi:hypothetical protein
MISMIPAGRIVEIGGQASTSAIARLALEVQAGGEPVVWVTGPTTSVHPPDLAEAGLSLHQLAFLRIHDDATGLSRIRAAELVLRSGGFGLVIIEAPVGALPARALSRLHAMARRHDTRVVFRRVSRADSRRTRVVDEGVSSERVFSERVLSERVVSERVVSEQAVSERVVNERVDSRGASLGPLIALKVNAYRSTPSSSRAYGNTTELRFEIQKNKVGPLETPSWSLRWPDGAMNPSVMAPAPLAQPVQGELFLLEGSAKHEPLESVSELNTPPLQEVG